jgi:hypothetical protein
MRLTVCCLTAMLAMIVAAPTSANANSFVVACTSSHVSQDDPIVFPGAPGDAHEHEFFGATTTSASSTTASLMRSSTSCGLRADTAAYWAPTMLVHGVRVTGMLHAYYERAGKRRAAAPPLGLRMIAGNPESTVSQGMRVTSWQCVDGGRSTQYNTVPRCRRGERLAAWVRFPDCWDGRHLDPADHRSHMAYAVAARCPASHPVELMRLALRVTWPVRPQHPGAVRLAGDMLAATGMHADFWNAWHEPALRQLRWDCIEVARPCGPLGG